MTTETELVKVLTRIASGIPFDNQGAIYGRKASRLLKLPMINVCPVTGYPAVNIFSYLMTVLRVTALSKRMQKHIEKHGLEYGSPAMRALEDKGWHFTEPFFTANSDQCFLTADVKHYEASKNEATITFLRVHQGQFTQHQRFSLDYAFEVNRRYVDDVPLLYYPEIHTYLDNKRIDGVEELETMGGKWNAGTQKWDCKGKKVSFEIGLDI